MIVIKQARVSDADLYNGIVKSNEFSIKLNKDIINEDISKLKEYKAKSKNKINRQNIDALIKYLDNICKKVDDESCIELCWVDDARNIVKTYPVEMINEPIYSINTCNYIELGENEKLVELDMTDLADIIAFEFMNRDLDETFESMENVLHDTKIIGGTDCGVLIDHIKSVSVSPFNLSKDYYIEDSPYFNYDDKVIYDYFNTRKFKSKKYRDVVDYSCRYANCIIANNIIKNCVSNSISYKMLEINATNISFIIDGNCDDELCREIIDEIAVRSFGRLFIVRPKINIF